MWLHACASQNLRRIADSHCQGNGISSIGARESSGRPAVAPPNPRAVAPRASSRRRSRSRSARSTGTSKHSSAAGVPVYAEPGRNGGCQLIDGYRTRLTGLTAKEAEALFMSGVPGPVGELGLGTVLGAAQLKVLAALPKDLADRASVTRQRFHLDAPSWFKSGRNEPHLAADRGRGVGGPSHRHPVPAIRAAAEPVQRQPRAVRPRAEGGRLVPRRPPRRRAAHVSRVARRQRRGRSTRRSSDRPSSISRGTGAMRSPSSSRTRPKSKSSCSRRRPGSRRCSAWPTVTAGSSATTSPRARTDAVRVRVRELRRRLRRPDVARRRCRGARARRVADAHRRHGDRAARVVRSRALTSRGQPAAKSAATFATLFSTFARCRSGIADEPRARAGTSRSTGRR